MTTPQDPQPARHELPGARRTSAMTEVLVSGVVGLIVGVLAAFFFPAITAVLLGWDGAVATYIVWVWLAIGRLDATGTARLAVREDPNRGTTDLLLLIAAVASLGAVGIVLGRAAGASGSKDLSDVALGLASVVLSWGLVHTVYTLRYAGLYYGDTPGGVDFNQDEPPSYIDFAYLAFTIGMTFQVSDTNLESSAVRHTALRHALLSFLFGTGILATTINLVASLTSH